MVSRELKRTSLHEKLQLLRSVTNSQAVNKTSIIVDASKYIVELKQKVERLNHDIACARGGGGGGGGGGRGPIDDDEDSPLPVQVTVETLENEKGFVIHVFSEKSCPGLLVSILEAFEDLGLNVLEARVSCTDTFRLEAVGGENRSQLESVDAAVVRQAVLQAIRNCREGDGGGEQ